MMQALVTLQSHHRTDEFVYGVHDGSFGLCVCVCMCVCVCVMMSMPCLGALDTAVTLEGKRTLNPKMCFYKNVNQCWPNVRGPTVTGLAVKKK